MEGREITPGSEQPRRRLGREILNKYEDERLDEAMDEMLDDDDLDDEDDDLDDEDDDLDDEDDDFFDEDDDDQELDVP